MTTYIGQPADQYRFIPPHPQARILTFPELPRRTPTERAYFDSEAAPSLGYL